MTSKTIRLAEHSKAKRENGVRDSIRKDAISINTLTNDHKKSYIELTLDEKNDNPTAKVSINNRDISAIS